MARQRACLLLILLSAAVLVVAAHSASGDDPEEISVDVAEDAYVKSSALDGNYGGYTLYAGKYGDAIYRAYLKFNLSALPEDASIEEATLFAYRLNGSLEPRISVYLAENGWSEGGITWNTRSTMAEEPCDTVKLLTAYALYEWDVGEAVAAAAQADPDEDGSRFVTLVLGEAPGAESEWARFAHSEQTYYPAAYLVIKCGEGGPPPDEEPPSIDFEALKDELWPPNGAMVLCAIVGEVSDNADPDPKVEVKVTANEAIKPKTDNSTDFDWEVKPNGDKQEIWLRAERNETEEGREYKISVVATDVTGNSATESATVAVPHDQGKKPGKSAKSGKG